MLHSCLCWCNTYKGKLNITSLQWKLIKSKFTLWIRSFIWLVTPDILNINHLIDTHSYFILLQKVILLGPQNLCVCMCLTWLNSKVISCKHTQTLDFRLSFHHSQPIFPHGNNLLYVDKQLTHLREHVLSCSKQFILLGVSQKQLSSTIKFILSFCPIRNYTGTVLLYNFIEPDIS